ncbi:MAG TPA: IS91 family transposase, partial [Gammaproteobacteria bacterium]|nr:IS91 family transposase [Gammaproteobacteria bacterium]
MFRARFLGAMNATGLTIPHNLPGEWVVDCKHVGRGQPALEYLSRYLYRGVISENNIVANQNAKVTFQYIEGRTGKTRTRTLKG